MTLYLQPNTKLKNINIFLGIIFFAQGVLNLLEGDYDFSFYFGIFQVLFGIFYGYYAYTLANPKPKNGPKITLGDKQIELKKDLFSKTRIILLEDIKLLQLKPENLTVMTKEFDFSYSFHYEALNKQEIMDGIAIYAHGKNIPVERVPYKNV